jgi:hypothetical protein
MSLDNSECNSLNVLNTLLNTPDCYTRVTWKSLKDTANVLEKSIREKNPLSADFFDVLLKMLPDESLYVKMSNESRIIAAKVQALLFSALHDIEYVSKFLSEETAIRNYCKPLNLKLIALLAKCFFKNSELRLSFCSSFKPFALSKLRGLFHELNSVAFGLSSRAKIMFPWACLAMSYLSTEDNQSYFKSIIKQ